MIRWISSYRKREGKKFQKEVTIWISFQIINIFIYYFYFVGEGLYFLSVFKLFCVFCFIGFLTESRFLTALCFASAEQHALSILKFVNKLQRKNIWNIFWTVSHFRVTAFRDVLKLQEENFKHRKDLNYYDNFRADFCQTLLCTVCNENATACCSFALELWS